MGVGMTTKEQKAAEKYARRFCGKGDCYISCSKCYEFKCDSIKDFHAGAAWRAKYPKIRRRRITVGHRALASAFGGTPFIPKKVSNNAKGK
jgi:hypothetical protein